MSALPAMVTITIRLTRRLEANSRGNPGCLGTAPLRSTGRVASPTRQAEAHLAQCNSAWRWRNASGGRTTSDMTKMERSAAGRDRINVPIPEAEITEWRCWTTAGAGIAGGALAKVGSGGSGGGATWPRRFPETFCGRLRFLESGGGRLTGTGRFVGRPGIGGAGAAGAGRGGKRGGGGGLGRSPNAPRMIRTISSINSPMVHAQLILGLSPGLAIASRMAVSD